MSESTPPTAPDLDENAVRLLGVINLLAEMAMQTLKQGEADGARSFVECIETLQVKTQGNVGDVETQAFEGILYQLRMAIVKGPPPSDDAEKPQDTPSDES
ncbi:MAG: DUF1844 domain-containing protein [Gemmatimonadetes bacterium]|nr:DUF1844 domain-containing protein [Gemmatimonadota bacterium]